MTALWIELKYWGFLPEGIKLLGMSNAACPRWYYSEHRGLCSEPLLLVQGRHISVELQLIDSDVTDCKMVQILSWLVVLSVISQSYCQNVQETLKVCSVWWKHCRRFSVLRRWCLYRLTALFMTSTKEVVFSPIGWFVCLWAGLHNKSWMDFNKTWWEGGEQTP